MSVDRPGLNSIVKNVSFFNNPQTSKKMTLGALKDTLATILHYFPCLIWVGIL